MNCADTYRVFFDPGEVVEIRAYGCNGKSKAWEGWARGAGIVFGYFDNPEAFGTAAEALERQKAPGIYFTINPVIPDLLARAANRLKAAGQKDAATTDDYIQCIRWLPIDLDPTRPSGISSTNEELKAAVRVRNDIYKFMRKCNWPDPVPAISGNGAHLCYRLPDLDNNETNKNRVRACLAALAALFSSEQVDVDQAVFNPSRIWKVYGTTARKGDHTPQRPHRKSYIETKWLEAVP